MLVMAENLMRDYTGVSKPTFDDFLIALSFYEPKIPYAVPAIFVNSLRASMCKGCLGNGAELRALAAYLSTLNRHHRAQSEVSFLEH